MEPSLIGWEWAAGRCGRRIEKQAAMEPSLIGWEWADPYGDQDEHRNAAMEPSLIGWEWRETLLNSRAISTSRNGAQPYRLGMAGRINRDVARR